MAKRGRPALRFYGVTDVEVADAGKTVLPEIRTVAFRDLAAVVEPTTYVRVKPGDAELQDYLHVVDALSERGPVIPAPPGTVFRNEQVLARWLDIHYAKLHETLGAIERRGDTKAPYDFVRMELGS